MQDDMYCDVYDAVRLREHCKLYGLTRCDKCAHLRLHAGYKPPECRFNEGVELEPPKYCEKYKEETPEKWKFPGYEIAEYCVMSSIEARKDPGYPEKRRKLDIVTQLTEDMCKRWDDDSLGYKEAESKAWKEAPKPTNCFPRSLNVPCPINDPVMDDMRCKRMALLISAYHGDKINKEEYDEIKLNYVFTFYDHGCVEEWLVEPPVQDNPRIKYYLDEIEKGNL